MANIFKNALKTNTNNTSNSLQIKTEIQKETNVEIPNQESSKKFVNKFTNQNVINSKRTSPITPKNMYNSNTIEKHGHQSMININAMNSYNNHDYNSPQDNIFFENKDKMNNFLEYNKSYLGEMHTKFNESVTNNYIIPIEQHYDMNIKPSMFNKFQHKLNTKKICDDNKPYNPVVDIKEMRDMSKENYKKFPPRDKLDSSSLANTTLNTVRSQFKSRNLDSVERRARKKSFLSEEIKDKKNFHEESANIVEKNLNPAERLKNLKSKIKKKTIESTEVINNINNAYIQNPLSLNLNDKEINLNLSNNSNEVKVNEFIKLHSNKSIGKSNNQQNINDIKKHKFGVKSRSNHINNYDNIDNSNIFDNSYNRLQENTVNNSEANFENINKLKTKNQDTKNLEINKHDEILDLNFDDMEQNQNRKYPIQTQVRGFLTSMCSMNEIKNREEQGQLQRFELDINNSYYDNSLKRHILKADNKKCIKAFARSAADNKLDNPDDIRTENTILSTLEYILTNIIDIDSKSNNEDIFRYSEEEKSMNIIEFIYDEPFIFAEDRFRAIRQEFTILSNKNEPPILEFKCNLIIARYLIISLNECLDFKSFTGHQGLLKLFKDQLNKTLSSLREYIDLYESLNNPHIISISEEEKNEVLFYSIVHNIERNIDIASMLSKYSSSSKNSSHRSLTLQFIRIYSAKDYVSFFKLIKKASYLNACILSMHIDYFRKEALSQMNQLSGKPISLTMGKLEDFLIFNTILETALYLEDFGIDVNNNFFKSENRNFKIEIKVTKQVPTRENAKFNISKNKYINGIKENKSRKDIITGQINLKDIKIFIDEKENKIKQNYNNKDSDLKRFNIELNNKKIFEQEFHKSNTLSKQENNLSNVSNTSDLNLFTQSNKIVDNKPLLGSVFDISSKNINLQKDIVNINSRDESNMLRFDLNENENKNIFNYLKTNINNDNDKSDKELLTKIESSTNKLVSNIYKDNITNINSIENPILMQKEVEFCNKDDEYSVAKKSSKNDCLFDKMDSMYSLPQLSRTITFRNNLDISNEISENIDILKCDSNKSKMNIYYESIKKLNPLVKRFYTNNYLIKMKYISNLEKSCKIFNNSLQNHKNNLYKVNFMYQLKDLKTCRDNEICLLQENITKFLASSLYCNENENSVKKNEISDIFQYTNYMYDKGVLNKFQDKIDSSIVKIMDIRDKSCNHFFRDLNKNNDNENTVKPTNFTYKITIFATKAIFKLSESYFFNNDDILNNSVKFNQTNYSLQIQYEQTLRNDTDLICFSTKVCIYFLDSIDLNSIEILLGNEHLELISTNKYIILVDFSQYEVIETLLLFLQYLSLEVIKKEFCLIYYNSKSNYISNLIKNFNKNSDERKLDFDIFMNDNSNKHSTLFKHNNYFDDNSNISFEKGILNKIKAEINISHFNTIDFSLNDINPKETYTQDNSTNNHNLQYLKYEINSSFSKIFKEYIVLNFIEEKKYIFSYFSNEIQILFNFWRLKICKESLNDLYSNDYGNIEMLKIKYELTNDSIKNFDNIKNKNWIEFLKHVYQIICSLNFIKEFVITSTKINDDYIEYLKATKFETEESTDIYIFYKEILIEYSKNLEKLTFNKIIKKILKSCNYNDQFLKAPNIEKFFEEVLLKFYKEFCIIIEKLINYSKIKYEHSQESNIFYNELTDCKGKLIKNIEYHLKLSKDTSIDKEFNYVFLIISYYSTSIDIITAKEYSSIFYDQILKYNKEYHHVINKTHRIPYIKNTFILCKDPDVNDHFERTEFIEKVETVSFHEFEKFFNKCMLEDIKSYLTCSYSTIKEFILKQKQNVSNDIKISNKIFTDSNYRDQSLKALKIPSDENNEESFQINTSFLNFKRQNPPGYKEVEKYRDFNKNIKFNSYYEIIDKEIKDDENSINILKYL